MDVGVSVGVSDEEGVLDEYLDSAVVNVHLELARLVVEFSADEMPSGLNLDAN